MAGEFRIDYTALEKAFRKSPKEVGKALTRTMDEVKADWTKESVDVAPMDPSPVGGNLRRQIQGKREGEGLTSVVKMTGNAYNTQDNFNYGLYIHEYDAGGGTLKLAGAEKKFLDKPAEDNTDKWKDWLEDGAKRGAKGAGW